MAMQAGFRRETKVDVIVVGAGFGGLYALHQAAFSWLSGQSA